jgi:hypothetical protein
MNPLIQCKTTILPLLIAGVLACFAISPVAQAVVPAPDGGYPGGNTAEGQAALFSLTIGGFNTGVGYLSLRSNTTASLNTAIGAGTLLANTTASENTAIGAGALLSNTGTLNTANGAFALFSNTTGNGNTANGDRALFTNTTGDTNTATGFHALFSTTTGVSNTANGSYALNNNTTGLLNTADGSGALAGNTTGDTNIALGSSAGHNLTTGSNNIDIGNDGLAGESSTIRIGSVQTKTFIAGIRGVTTINSAIPVLIDTVGQLGTTSSSRRFKKHIKPMDQASESIHALKPVTFHYKSDSNSTPQFGLIAEEVARVNPDLVVRDENGEIYTVRYDAVNAMLLNEFLKEHRKVQELQATVVGQQKSFQSKLAEQEKQIAALASGFQKMRAQFELSKPSSRTVLNDH